MDSKGFLSLFLLLLLSFIIGCSVGTKSAHWDRTPSGFTYDLAVDSVTGFPQFYRCLFGLIATDSFFCLIILISMLAVCIKSPTFIKILQITIILTLVCRFILGVIFLAGDDEFGRYAVEYYDDLPDYDSSSNVAYRGLVYNVSIRDFWTTLKGAWVYEIICIILSALVTPCALISMSKAAAAKIS